jgi:hypothetical protein
LEGLLSIDHIAHTTHPTCGGATRFSSKRHGGGRLSDHDGYVATLTPAQDLDRTDEVGTLARSTFQTELMRHHEPAAETASPAILAK